DRGEAAVPVPKQGGGNDTGSKAKVSSCLDDMIWLYGANQRIPSQPSRPVRFLRTDSATRIGRQTSCQLVGKVVVFLQFFRPRPYLPDLRAGDSRNEPAELVPVERVQVIGKVGGLAVVHQPIDRSFNEMGVVTCHDHSAQRKCRTPGDSRGGDASP